MASLLTTLSRMNRTKVFLGALALGVLGVFLPGAYGAALLYAMVAGLAALLSLTWKVTPPALCVARLAILAGVAAVATLKLLS